MDWAVIGGVAEIVGAIVVVLSLGYVGLQIKQNTNLAAGEAQRELMNGFQAQLDRIANEPDIFRRGLAGLDNLTDTEKVTFHLIFNQWINHLEQPLRMLERGLETQDNVDMYGNICLLWVQEPGGWQIWEMNREYYFPRSHQYIDSRLADAQTLPPRVSDVFPWFVANNEQ